MFKAGKKYFINKDREIIINLKGGVRDLIVSLPTDSRVRISDDQYCYDTYRTYKCKISTILYSKENECVFYQTVNYIAESCLTHGICDLT